ncbi:gp53-like domain-containing protein, partial [Escherichia coli]|uniref:gp53-like domain-containing protein n=1 Tax=Escherichia coli TaxID=562 RepID=UPI003F6BEFFD
LLTALRALLLSRKNPFGDIKSDGTVKTALENLGLGEAAKRNVGTGENQIPSMSEWTSGTGWNRDPSGRIIQRGFAMASNQTNILFPIPFPYDDFEVIVCAADTGTNKGAVNVLRKSRQGFSVSQVGSMPVAYRWIAG